VLVLWQLDHEADIAARDALPAFLFQPPPVLSPPPVYNRALLDAIDEQERRDEAKRRQEEENARLGYATNG
jgi:hypothetical protein